MINRLNNNNQGTYNFNFNFMMDSLNNANNNIQVYRVENIDDFNVIEASANSSTSSISDSINTSASFNNLSGFEKKKLELILEMDEYQYKHIQKYEDSRKETSCVICLGEFKGNDIIKAFYKCNHIFHKKCLLNWLKDHDNCPLCKHNLKDDIH